MIRSRAAAGRRPVRSSVVRLAVSSVALTGVLGLAALAFALWQVLSRYFFPRQSISYAEEVIVYLVIWAYRHGAP